MKGFLNFVREQGVVGLAVGFILGGSISKVVTSIVTDIINPLVGVILGSAKGLENASVTLGEAKIKYGHFLSVLIDFLIIALVVYILVKAMRFDRIDRKKS